METGRVGNPCYYRVLQVENNYDVINNRLPISMARVGRVHGCAKMTPVLTGVNTGVILGSRKYGRHFWTP